MTRNWRHMGLAWGLLFSVLLAVWIGVWTPLNEEVESEKSRGFILEKRIRSLQGLQGLRQRYAATLASQPRGAASAGPGRFITAKSAALGAAELQRRLKQAIDGRGGRQSSSQPIAGKKSNGRHKLEVIVNFSATMDALQAILFEIEVEDPKLFVQQALIQKQRLSRGGRTTDDVERTPILRVRLHVAAYLLETGKNDAALAVR